jgi:hypothetical protein
MVKRARSARKRAKSTKSSSATATITTKKFDVDKLSPAIKKSPIKIRDWLDLHLPILIGPRIDSFDPAGGQRGTILTIHGARFATNRSDNEVTIGGIVAPVLAASSRRQSE